MNGSDNSTVDDSDLDAAPDLSRDGWPEKFEQAVVRRGQPPLARPKVSTTIRLSQDVIDRFGAGLDDLAGRLRGPAPRPRRAS